MSLILPDLLPWPWTLRNATGHFGICFWHLLLADVFPAVHCSGSDCFAASSHQPGVSPEELLSLAWASAVSRSDPGLKWGLRQFGLLHEPWLTFAVQKGKRKIVRPSWLPGNQSTRVWVPPPSTMCYHPASRVQTTTVLGLRRCHPAKGKLSQRQLH